MLILGAGHDTTTNPDRQRRAGAIAELRQPGADHRSRRHGRREIAGHPIRRGTVVALLLGVANRDPARFADPDPPRHRPPGQPSRPLRSRPHFCLGAALVRVEAQIVIATLLRRFADFDGDQHPKDWKRSVVLRGPTILWLWW
jgi:cytochrome P450